MQAFQRTYALNSLDLDALTNVGKCYEQLSQLDQAQQAYLRVLQHQDNHRDARLNLALLYHSRQQFTDAIKQFDVLLVQGFTDAEVMFNRAVSFEGAGRIGDAITAYEDSLRLHPQNPRSMLNLAALHQAYGDLRLARDLYETLMSILSSKYSDRQDEVEHLVMARHNYAAIQYQLGSWSLSIEIARAIQATVLGPDRCTHFATATQAGCEKATQRTRLLAARTELLARRASGSWEGMVRLTCTRTVRVLREPLVTV
jgi:tetratricopeptide (TPR) repeat protein